MNKGDYARVRAERRARETQRLDHALGKIGNRGCPWCKPALFSDWDYAHDRPEVDAEHDQGCPGPSDSWHKRGASNWLLAWLDFYGYRVSDYAVGDNDEYNHLARHHTAKAA